jgi:hypothetical protein
MKKIKFFRDFQGVETGGLFYKRDTEYTVDDSLAARMINDKRAALVGEQVEPQKISDTVQLPKYDDYTVTENIYSEPDDEPEFTVKPKRRSKSK